MAEDEAEAEGLEEPTRKSKLPMFLGLVLMLALGGGGFFAVYTGMILPPGGDDHAEEKEMTEPEPLPAVAFVPIDPLVINLGRSSSNRHLKFRAQLEVEPEAEEDVTGLLPRVTDVLNGYLRAVDVSELEQPTALIRLRAQMLRRVQIVAGEGRVRDLLIMEFVLN